MNDAPKIHRSALGGHAASGLWLRRLSRLPHFTDHRVRARVAAELTLHPIQTASFAPAHEADRKSVDARRVA